MFKNKLEQNIPLMNTCLIIIAAAALTWILIYTKSMLMPLTLTHIQGHQNLRFTRFPIVRLN